MHIDPTAPCPSPFNLARYVLEQGTQHPEKIALEVMGDQPESLSYAALIASVRGVARGLLELGLSPGDIVLMRLGNTPDFPLAYLGAIAAGLIAVPTSSALTQAEITPMAASLNPALVITAPGVSRPEPMPCAELSLEDLQAMYSAAPAPWHMGDADRPAYIVFTSGTSGKPRAVLHAHRAIWARRMMHQGWYGLRADDRLLHAGAFNWTFTLGTGLMDPWTLGATALIPRDGTPPSALGALLAAHRATIFAAAPGVFRKLLQTDLPKLPDLRHALSAGEKMPLQTQSAWRAATGTAVYEAFGMSECSTFISSCPDHPAPAEAMGYAQPGRRVALLDDTGEEVEKGETGVIAVHRSDPGLMLGYHAAPEETEARFSGPWFKTGDLARQDAEGAFIYQGRGDDMMNAGGFRVSPLEVEAAFQGQSGITLCAACEVTLKAGVQVIALGYSAAAPISQDALEALASQRLARYKRPRLYVFQQSLPTSANGKLQRRELRSQIEATHGQA